jgi:phenylacetate-CoA ligase
MDAYGRLLGNVLYPGWERLRGRDPHTVGRLLDRTQYAPLAELHDLQSGYLRRLLRHAYAHTAHYRSVMDAAGVRPEDVRDVRDLARLPILDKPVARASEQDRIADAPPRAVVVKTTSGTTGAPLIVRYNAESRVWRDATRWRGYGWAGYRPGMRAFHYWGVLATPPTGWRKWKVELDHALRRDHYVDCGRRSVDDLERAIAVAARGPARGHAGLHPGRGGAGSARQPHQRPDLGRPAGDLRRRAAVAHDRDQMVKAFGPGIFESYGCREVMLIGHECDRHDGLHLSMETMIVEVLVREGDGCAPRSRAKSAKSP